MHNDHSPDTTRLYAWLSRDADGIEGIVAVPTPDGVRPLVTVDRERALRLEVMAEIAARMREFPAQLVAFDRAEMIREVGGS